MAQIQPLTTYPAAFAPIAAKLNEVIAEMNARELKAGPGIQITPSANGALIELGRLTGTLTCTEGGGGIITITAS